MTDTGPSEGMIAEANAGKDLADALNRFFYDLSYTAPELFAMRLCQLGELITEPMKIFGYNKPVQVAVKHVVQSDVEDFHRVVCEIPTYTTPEIRRPELRASLIAEEAKETLEAITGLEWVVEPWDDPDQPVAPSLVDAIDGMCDLLCVIYGTAAEFGVDLAPFWDEVHRSNMAKAGGPVREDGKRLKPEGWNPPDIEGVLRNVMKDAA